MFNEKKYLADANEKFLGFDGDEYMDFDEGSIDLSADGGEAGAVPAQSPNPYSLIIENTAGSTATAVLFGRNTYLVGSTNYGSAASIVITPAYSNVSYVEVLQQSGDQPFISGLLRIQSSNSAQVTQMITVTTKDANGQQFSAPLITQNYFSSMQFQSGIIDVELNLTINANTYLSFSVLGSTSVTMTFFPAEKFNPARTVLGQSGIKRYGRPNVPTINAFERNTGGSRLLVAKKNA
jgi:hypothetical protein